MLQCWQEHPCDRPSFVQLRAQFDMMLSKQKNAEELYIFIQADDAPPVELKDLEEKMAKLEPEQKPAMTEPEVKHENPYVENPIHRAHHLSNPDLSVSSSALAIPGNGNYCYSHSFTEDLSSSTAGAFQAE